MALDRLRTKTELREAVARKLRILGKGLPLDATDAQVIDDRIDDIFSELEHEGKLNFDIDDTTAIETKLFRPLVAIIAYDLTEEFTVSAALMQVMALKAAEARIKLKELLFEQYNSGDTKTDYY